ncbi:hypothetical protein CCP3SC1_170033 [Gammaproteobacteria bacterium]
MVRENLRSFPKLPMNLCPLTVLFFYGLGGHDLFHIQQDLVRGVFPGLGREIKRDKEQQEALAKITAI